MADSKLNVILTADDRTGGVFKSFGSGLQKVGALAVGAGAAGAAALVGVAAAGANAFINFEGQMNEVFTLLPDISQTAMDDMSGQVLQFSRDFGTLPEEVVPALYQALSAGVPQGNVFEFMETAQKAATGGITELETAVDGITSVVNAYGADVVGAAAASDLMFTAVRLGKTDFDQLSSSLFNVIPTAASLGVNFETVTAAMATLTAQGTPTSVATTQLRGLLVEASKAGTGLDTAIRELTGKGLTELTAEGGNVAEILQQVREASGDEEFRNMFGSVEALNAALGITGPNASVMAGNLAEMGASAGATDAAFEQMDSGIGRSIEKFKAFGSTVLIQIGDALSPFIEKAISLAESVLPMVQIVLEDVSAFLTGFFSELESGNNIIDAIIEAFLNWTNVGENIPMEMFDFIVNLRDALFNLWEQLQPTVEGIINAITEFVSWKDILIAVGVAIAAVLIPIIVSLVVSLAPIILAIVAVIAVVAFLRNVWENDFLGIRTALENFWENHAKPVFEVVKQWLEIVIPAAIAVLKMWWEVVLLPAIKAVWTWIKDTLIPFFRDVVVPWLKEKIVQALENLSNTWEFVLKPAIEAVWTFIKDSIVPLFVALWDLLQVAGDLALTALAGIWENVLQPALNTVWTFIKDNILPLFDTLWTFIRDNLSPIIETVASKFDAFGASIGGVKGVIESIIGWVQNLTDALGSVSLPGWATPGSPTPFELGLRGMNAAMMDMSRQGLPAMRSGFTNVGGNSTRTQTNNFNLNLVAQQSSGDILTDFGLMQARVGGI
jgi:TP901 family phage tail tape measure protein